MEIIDIAMKDYGIPPIPETVAEAMAYIPYQQQNSKTYTPAQALESGTVYPVLDKPFFGGKCSGGKDD